MDDGAVGPGEHVRLTSGVVLEVDVIFERVMEFPGDEEPGG